MYFTLEIRGNNPPIVMKILSNVTMYYGQGAINYTIVKDAVYDDRGIITYSIISPNSTSASTYFKTLEIDKSNNLLIKIEANLLVFDIDIIIQASDDNNQTVNLSFHVQVLP